MIVSLMLNMRLDEAALSPRAAGHLPCTVLKGGSEDHMASST